MRVHMPQGLDMSVLESIETRFRISNESSLPARSTTEMKI